MAMNEGAGAGEPLLDPARTARRRALRPRRQWSLAQSHGFVVAASGSGHRHQQDLPRVPEVRFLPEVLRGGKPEGPGAICRTHQGRSEEHTSELQSLMRNSYAVF